MAFFGKVGNILRQSTSQQISSELSAPKLSLFQAIRCMSTKLFIGGLSYNTDEPGLRDAFAKYGEVIEAKVIVDRETGNSRGFGFVTFSTQEEASSAIQALSGQDLHGRNIRVDYATERAPRSYGGGGGYGGYQGGGGYGGGGYQGGGGYGGGGYQGGGGYNSGGYQGGGGGYGGGGNGGYQGGGGGNYGNNYASGGSSYNTAGGGGGSDEYTFGADGGNTGVSGEAGGFGLNDEPQDDFAKRA